jgi:hypothetical protein
MKQFTNNQRKALADILTNDKFELSREVAFTKQLGAFRGKYWHHNNTIRSLVKQGYLSVNKTGKSGLWISVMPTEKAVYCIPASA